MLSMLSRVFLLSSLGTVNTLHIFQFFSIEQTDEYFDHYVVAGKNYL